jgi:hypothetical protein
VWFSPSCEFTAGDKRNYDDGGDEQAKWSRGFDDTRAKGAGTPLCVGGKSATPLVCFAPSGDIALAKPRRKERFALASGGYLNNLDRLGADLLVVGALHVLNLFDWSLTIHPVTHGKGQKRQKNKHRCWRDANSRTWNCAHHQEYHKGH